MLRLRAAPKSLLSSELEVKVSDTGIGIPESALPRLFDRFYRRPSSHPCCYNPAAETPAGSGLAIAQAIVETTKAKFRPKVPCSRHNLYRYLPQC